MARYIDADVLIKRMKPVAEYEYNDTRRKAFNEILDYVQKMPTTTEAEIREQAITEFAEEILKNSQTANRSPFNNDYTVLIHKFVIDEIATELKGE